VGGNLPTFRENPIGPILKGQVSFWTATETSVTNYESTLRNISEERQLHVHRGGSLKSHINFVDL